MNDLSTMTPERISDALEMQNQREDLMRNTFCKGSTPEEFALFKHVCRHTGLDPAMKQIYAVKRWDAKSGRETMTIQTSIDGYRLIAERTGKYAPGREPTYVYDDKGGLVSSTAYVKKMTPDGTWHETAATAFFIEYAQTDKQGRPTRFWLKMGHLMLAKCAEALCLRKAFPAELSGTYTKEEMTQADVETETVVPVIAKDSADIKDPVAKISEDQADDLKKLLDQCHEDDQARIWKYFNGKPFEMTSLDDLPQQAYTVILKRIATLAEKNREVAHAAV